MKVLVIAVHPDDEVIGCGGSIALHSAKGDSVHVLVMTQIYSPEWDMKEFRPRRTEALKASKVLGIKKVHFAGLPTAKLNTLPVITIAGKISAFLKQIKPDIVYVPPKRDVNVDHVVCYKAALVALKSMNSVKKILSYEIPTVFGFKGFEKNLYADISRTMEKKIKAMRAYKLEIKKYPHPRSAEGLKIIGRERGLAIGVKYAEAFYIEREIKR